MFIKRFCKNNKILLTNKRRRSLLFLITDNLLTNNIQKMIPEEWNPYKSKIPNAILFKSSFQGNSLIILTRKILIQKLLMDLMYYYKLFTFNWDFNVLLKIKNLLALIIKAFRFNGTWFWLKKIWKHIRIYWKKSCESESFTTTINFKIITYWVIFLHYNFLI